MVQTIMIAMLISLDFDAILCIDNFFTAVGAVLEFAAIVKLRIAAPELPRPYRIPLGTAGLVAFLAIPTSWSLVICYVTFRDSIQSAITISASSQGPMRYACSATRIAMPRALCPVPCALCLRPCALGPRPHASI